MYVPDGEKPSEEQGGDLNLKELYEKFRGTKSHALSSIPFHCGLNLFLVENEKNVKEVINKLYQNLSLKTFSENSEYWSFNLMH